MRFQNVDNVEVYAVSVLVVQLIEGRNLPPERRSSVTAKH
jgi:hypothetical protein